MIIRKCALFIYSFLSSIYKKVLMMKSSFPARLIRLIKNGGIACLFFVVMLQVRDTAKISHRRLQKLPEVGKFPGLYLPYLIFPLDGEELTEGSLLVEYKQGISWQTRINLVTTNTAWNKTYYQRPFEEVVFTAKGNNKRWKKYGTRLGAVGDYFKYLRESQIDCRKLKRMGGGIQCLKGRGDANQMDGHKYVCLDPVLRLSHGKNDSRQCLIMSYGVQTDTSFDEGISDLPCEVHMFDVLDFSPRLTSDVDQVHFHVEGIAGMPRVNNYFNINMSTSMDTLRNHVTRYNLSSRLIHVLKVDTEGAEWEAFGQIAQDPIFDAVGQVALEVHAVELVKGLKAKHFTPVPEERWLDLMQSRYEVLRAIEARGFRRVLYWENGHEDYQFYDTDGKLYATSGEILYINTNWYNPAFMKMLADRGYEFQDVT